MNQALGMCALRNKVRSLMLRLLKLWMNQLSVCESVTLAFTNQNIEELYIYIDVFSVSYCWTEILTRLSVILKMVVGSFRPFPSSNNSQDIGQWKMAQFMIYHQFYVYLDVLLWDTVLCFRKSKTGRQFATCSPSKRFGHPAFRTRVLVLSLVARRRLLCMVCWQSFSSSCALE